MVISQVFSLGGLGSWDFFLFLLLKIFGLNIGEDFIPHKLAVFLDEEIPELKSIQFKYPEDYIKILDDEIGISNTITIEMV